MLPKELCENKYSLLENEERNCSSLVIDYKTRNPNVPAIPLINEVTGEEKVIWVLKTK